MEKFLHILWYHRKLRYLAYLLSPFCLLYMLGSKLNGWWGRKQRKYFNIPVIVIGNLTVGGTGKTPVLIALTQALQQEGYNVGIISRGYKSAAEYAPTPVLITRDHTAAEVGDEPLLIFEKTSALIAVHSNRNEAIQTLLNRQPGLDLILSDDGLQNTKLNRDLAVVVLGQQGFGNGLLLPAGPLRETTARLKQVDFCIENGRNFQFTPVNVPTLTDRVVHAVAGIGHPERFFQTLAKLGFTVIPHVFPDHHAFLAADFKALHGHPIIMTEKDAVKCRDLQLDNTYVLQMQATIDSTLLHDFLAKVRYTIAAKKESLVSLQFKDTL